MITANVIHRVFFLKRNTSIATGFTIDHDNRQYLITAKHFLPETREVGELEINSNGKWISLEVELVGGAEGEGDIVVLAASKVLSPPSLELPATSQGLFYGQGVYFLGFPYGQSGGVILGDDGYPLPFVKKAIVSQLQFPKFFLDGHNNPGFSGGPVVFHPPNRPTEFQIAGVVSGFRSVENPVMKSGAATDMTFQYNTGIIVAYDVNMAISVIESNPVGCEL